MSIGRADFLDAAKTEYKVVDIGGLGDVRLRNLSAIEVENMRVDADNPLSFGLRAIIASVVDDDGEQVLQADDFEQLGRLPLPAIEGIIEEISELNGFGAEDIVEDLELTPPEDSSTNLPAN